MIIQLNTDHNIDDNKAFGAKYITLMNDKLWWYSNHITSVEALITDEDDTKSGQKEICCMLKAQVDGMQTLTVISYANTHFKAVEGAIHRLKSSLETKLSRIRDKDITNTLYTVY